MPTNLHQLVALQKGVQADANAAITKAYHVIQKKEPFAGIARTYTPKDDDGDQLPPESTRVQVRSADLLAGDVRAAWTRLFDLVASKDATNAEATADIVVGETVIVRAVPVTYLLWLEKQLIDVHTFVSKLPVLDNANEWEQNANGDWATPPTQTVKSKKVPQRFVKYEATKEHPAQVEMYYEDVTVGTWTTIKYSGGIPAARQRELLARVVELQAAVKIAREAANSTTVTDKPVGAAIFDYLLA